MIACVHRSSFRSGTEEAEKCPGESNRASLCGSLQGGEEAEAESSPGQGKVT